MAKSYEPDPKRFKAIFLISLVFLSFMAVLIIKRKNQKMEKKQFEYSQPVER